MLAHTLTIQYTSVLFLFAKVPTPGDTYVYIDKGCTIACVNIKIPEAGLASAKRMPCTTFASVTMIGLDAGRWILCGSAGRSLVTLGSCQSLAQPGRVSQLPVSMETIIGLEE